MKITITAPTDVNFGETTREPTGWRVDRSDTVITWSGGRVAPAHFDQWGYEIEGADQPGTLTYKVTLGFTDGKTDDVNVQTTAVAAGTAPTTVAAGGGAVTTEATGTTPAAKAGGGSSARSRANIAIGLGAVALVAALVALGLAARRRANGAADSTAGGAEKQDW